MALPLTRILAAAALLLAAAAPARAMFRPGPVLALGRDLGLDVRASAALEDGSLLVLDAAKPCARCLAAGARADCPHAGKPRLLHCRKLAGGAGAKEDWEARPVCSLPATTAGILGVRGTTVYLNELLEGVVRVPLARRHGVLRAARSQVALGPGDLLDLGLTFGCAPNLALAPDGSLVLAFDDAVALLPPAAGGWGSLRWLLGRAPQVPLPPGTRPSLVPSVAGDGTIHVVDRAKRAVFRFAPGDRKLSVVAKEGAWPDERSVPVLAAAHGEHLLVSLCAADSGQASLAAVLASTIPGARVAQRLDLPLDPNEAIRFTAQGDLLLTDVRKGGLRLVRARGEEAKRPEAPMALPAKAGPAETKDPGPRLVPADKSDRLAIARSTLAFAESKAFERAFAQWAQRLGGAGTVPDGQDLAPSLGPFSLSHGGLKAVVRWLLANADEANHPADMAEWLAQGRAARPRFSFGLYRHARHAGVVLELDDLQAFAARIDEAAGGSRVAAELEPAGGVSGYRVDRHGVPRYHQGLTVTLGPDLQSLVSIHPGGNPGLGPDPSGHP